MSITADVDAVTGADVVAASATVSVAAVADAAAAGAAWLVVDAAFGVEVVDALLLMLMHGR